MMRAGKWLRLCLGDLSSACANELCVSSDKLYAVNWPNLKENHFDYRRSVTRCTTNFTVQIGEVMIQYVEGMPRVVSIDTYRERANHRKCQLFDSIHH